MRSLRGLLKLLRQPIGRSPWHSAVLRRVSKMPGDDSQFSRESLRRDQAADFSHWCTWAIICEEMLDTVNSQVYFRRAYEELKRRGITDQEYHAMRMLAWRTAGWLNFAMMLWDWCSLDASDMRLAIKLQLEQGLISPEQGAKWIEQIERYCGRIHQGRSAHRPSHN